jgi:precorrin-6y C5,15-methyltransferase (decarboxylating) CbiE subunit
MSNIGEMWVVGVGPGDPEYVTIKATKLIERADYVAGFKQALQVVEKLIKGKMLIIDYTNEEEVLKLLASEEKAGKRCVICSYGDPNFSDKQFVEKVKSVCMNVKVVPGISSVQVSCAKAGLAMEESIFITFHKSGPINNEREELLRVVKEGHRNAIVLPRPWDFMPKDIAKFLIDNGVAKNLEVTVYENLTLRDEKVHVCKLSDLLNTEHSDLSIIILKKRWPRPL